MKLTQKVNYFTVFESLPSTYSSLVAAPEDPAKWLTKKLAGWKCKLVSGMFSSWEIDWRQKVTVQNCSRIYSAIDGVDTFILLNHYMF